MEYVVKPVVGDVYISSVYNQVATDLDIKSVEPNSDAERYQNPNALAQRVLSKTLTAICIEVNEALEDDEWFYYTTTVDGQEYIVTTENFVVKGNEYLP